jgi:hypothetical protein
VTSEAPEVPDLTLDNHGALDVATAVNLRAVPQPGFASDGSCAIDEPIETRYTCTRETREAPSNAAASYVGFNFAHVPYV